MKKTIEKMRMELYVARDFDGSIGYYEQKPRLEADGAFEGHAVTFGSMSEVAPMTCYKMKVQMEIVEDV